MGSICTNNFEGSEPTQPVDSKNFVKISVSLGNYCTIDLITGNFRQQKSESLFIITETAYVAHCDPIRQYASEPEKLIQSINSQRKLFQKAGVNKHSPYKKLLIAIMPRYCTQESQQYQQHFSNILKQVINNSKDITIQLINTIQNVSQIPNQMILAILFKQLQQCRSKIKVNLITNQKKMMNLYKYELLKTENSKMRLHQDPAKDYI